MQTLRVAYGYYSGVTKVKLSVKIGIFTCMAIMLWDIILYMYHTL